MSIHLALKGGIPVREDFLPFFKHSIGSAEINEVIDTLKSDWITTGPKTKKFEEKFCDYTGAKNAVAVNSCTAGLHISLAAHDIGPGDEVITSPYTFAATINVIIHTGARPVLVDINKNTFNIDENLIEEALSPRTKAIIPVHFAGYPCNMDKIKNIAEKKHLIVIEDAAHALGAKYGNQKIGTIGDTTCFSFYATKNITTGEGGMITTNSEKIAEKMRIMSLHGISKDAYKRYSSEGSWFYEILCPGFKYNMTDIQASMGIHQLEKLDLMQARREEIARKYSEKLRHISEIRIPSIPDTITHAWHLYPLLIHTELLTVDRAQFIEALRAENIGASVHFIPIHLHPYYQHYYSDRTMDLQNSEYVYRREISLPLFPAMSDQDIEDVISSIIKIVDFYRK